jgi:ABC-type branched-subunit amino acid transport system ATPase component
MAQSLILDGKVAVISGAALALKVCSRVYVLDDGQTAHEETTAELMADEEPKRKLLGI